ncbi:hypothetical protein [Amycolatopsis sp. NBC_01480]|uniref:hypothetical protein n=1 Tax=Amycolatopsis sp. NBC_01480 TaxID=2903562 RepID=UPI002E2A4E9B|nr:hypothetical protein [Amycolatopsis sp. NBC_01480]
MPTLIPASAGSHRVLHRIAAVRALRAGNSRLSHAELVDLLTTIMRRIVTARITVALIVDAPGR